MMDLETLRQQVIDGEQEAAVESTKAAVAQGCAPDVILRQALFPAMDEVGRRMQCHEFFIPEVLMSARTMQACAGVLRPLIVEDPSMQPLGTAVACTVAGDLHDVGKNLVCLMLEGTGFDIVDLGHDCSAEKVVAAVREHRPDVVALSAMLTTTMLNMKKILDALSATGLRDRVHVMVGGAPVDASFAREIGADFYGDDAPAASAHARRLVEARAPRAS